MLDMAYAIAQGREWHGRRTKQAPVLYICCEGAGGFDKRILAATKIHNPPGAHFAVLAVPVTLSKEATGNDGVETVIEAYQELAANAQADTPGLIVVDTKARATAGDDENSTADTMTFIEQRVGVIAQATGAAIAVVHHPNKDGGIRGSSSLEGAADVVLRAARGDNGEPRPLKSTKVKEGEEGPLFSYDLDIVALDVDADGVPVRSCTVKARATGGLTERQTQCLELTKNMMCGAIGRGERLSPKPRANNNAARWLAKKQPATANFSKEEFGAALKLAPALGLRVTQYTHKGHDSECYELAPPLPGAFAAHSLPAVPAHCRRSQTHAPEPHNPQQIRRFRECRRID